jgi:outer membrane protein TolC
MFSLRDALQLAVKHNPNLRSALEIEVQARAQRDALLTALIPTVTLGWQYRINDREVSFDPSESFGGGDLGSAFEPIYGNLGYILGEMNGEGWIDNDDCNQLALINGFADCAELTEAFIGGQDFSPPAPDAGDDEPSGPIVVQPKTQQFLNLQGSWPLSLRTIAMGRASTNNLGAARAQVQQSRDQVMLSVVRAYAGAWQLQEALVLRAGRIAVTEVHLRDSQALSDAGMVTRDALLRARLEVEKARRERREGKQLYRQAMRGLALALGMPKLEVGKLTAIPTIEIARVDGAALVDDALATRPDARAAEAQDRAARDLKADAVLQFLPQFSVTGKLSWSDQSAGFDSKRSSWWIGLGVNLPIWDGGQRIQNARNAASSKRQAEARLEAVRLAVRTEVHNAWDAYQLRRAAVRVVKLELELAAEVHSLVQARYQSGQATQVEVLDAGSGLALAEYSLLQATTERELAAAELLAAAGRVDEAAP